MHRLNIRLDNETIRVSLNLKARIVTFAEYLTCGRIHKCENLLLKWSSNVISNARTLIFGGLVAKQDWQKPAAQGQAGAEAAPNIVLGGPSIVVAPKEQLQQQLQQHSFCRALKVATDLHAEVKTHLSLTSTVFHMVGEWTASD